MAEYPEHEKMAKIVDKSQEIGQFLEWLQNEKGLVICQNGITDEKAVYWSQVRDDFESDEEWANAAKEAGVLKEDVTSLWLIVGTLRGVVHHWEPYQREGYYPYNLSIVQTLAEYFGIDLDKIEKEKRQMLANLRASASQT